MNLLLNIGLAIVSLLPQADDTFWRDSIPQEMRQSYIQYGEQYPVYNWKKNKGYPTQQHKQAIADYGTTPLHRMTFNMAIQLKLDLK